MGKLNEFFEGPMKKLTQFNVKWICGALGLLLFLSMSASAEEQPALADPILLTTKAETLIYSEPAKAVELLLQALRIIEERPDFEVEYRIKILLSDSYVQLDRLQDAIQLLQNLRQRINDKSQPNKKAQVFSRLGEVYWYQGEVFRSIDLLEQSLNLYRASGSQIDVSGTLNNLGIMYRHLGDYELALNYFLNSLSVKQKLNDSSGVTSTLNNIGVLYFHLGKYYEAIDYYDQSIAGYHKLGDRVNLADPLNNKGQALEQLGNLDDAIEYYQQSLIIEQETADKRGQGFSHANIGAVLRKSEQFEEAKLHLSHALQLAVESESPAVETEVRLQMGLLNLDTRLLDAAREHFLTGLTIAEKTSEKEKVREFHKYLSQVFEANSKYELALKHFRLFKQVSEELLNSDSKERLTRIEFKNKLEQREREITLLKQENQIQALEIEHALTEKYIVFGASIAGVIITLLSFAIVVHRKQLFREREISDQLSQLDQLKTQFFAHTSSELLSPIQKITQLASMLRHSDFRHTEQQQHLNALEGFTGKLHLMIRNLLDFSAERNNKLALKLSNNSLSDIIYKVIDLKQLDLNNSKISFNVQLAKDEYRVSCDLERIRQVLFNCLNYLIARLDSGNIGVQAAEVDNRIMVRISNLPLTEELEHQNAHSQSVTSDDGFELNLASSIIDLHGGELWLEQYQSGYTICFTLPLQNR